MPASACIRVLSWNKGLHTKYLRDEGRTKSGGVWRIFPSANGRVSVPGAAHHEPRAEHGDRRLVRVAKARVQVVAQHWVNAEDEDWGAE